MAFKKVEGANKISLAKQAQGTEWAGQFVKKYEIDSKLSPTGKQSIWQFLDEDGNTFEFYGCASLDIKMNQVPVGAIVKIKHAGTYKSKFGRDAASVEVEYDNGEAA